MHMWMWSGLSFTSCLEWDISSIQLERIFPFFLSLSLSFFPVTSDNLWMYPNHRFFTTFPIIIHGLQCLQLHSYTSKCLSSREGSLGVYKALTQTTVLWSIFPLLSLKVFNVSTQSVNGQICNILWYIFIITSHNKKWLQSIHGIWVPSWSLLASALNWGLVKHCQLLAVQFSSKSVWASNISSFHVWLWREFAVRNCLLWMISLKEVAFPH